ncbi:hypothetical protein SAMD00019534_005550 [Acytostelium subglobosum LB1]|uniref:hypothetical protein n=1 Tax=Acytostelium subglobosum LB1 TaxID=1410327 RepID=UPI0006449A00|nr:hypothetical protein SAMD00019534_005550 [Acytostelium subglobosum LB1]GAM17380.1 hypothetical protein SAMD00019534_005550 [Acytostelium subglobosum LB1]|eukprot:XP_012759442.1 hypothetical protein SAMD00019534_005550 [Acytostelium subglobosum LB1]
MSIYRLESSSTSSIDLNCDEISINTVTSEGQFAMKFLKLNLGREGRQSFITNWYMATKNTTSPSTSYLYLSNVTITNWDGTTTGSNDWAIYFYGQTVLGFNFRLAGGANSKIVMDQDATVQLSGGISWEKYKLNITNGAFFASGARLGEVTQTGGDIIFKDPSTKLYLAGPYSAPSGKASITFIDALLPGTNAPIEVDDDITVTFAKVNVQFIKTSPVFNQPYRLMSGFTKIDYKTIVPNVWWNGGSLDNYVSKIDRVDNSFVLNFYEKCIKCNGRGYCLHNDTCVCDQYYQVVDNCSIKGCYQNCSARGVCAKPGTDQCQCDLGFVGQYCQLPSSSCAGLLSDTDCSTVPGCTWSGNTCQPNSSNSIFGSVFGSTYIVGLLIAVIIGTFSI